MAKTVQLNTYITKAIYSGCFFTRTDTKRDKTINENKNVSDETWDNRFKVIDSPNNVDGLIIASNGIYVVRRFKPAQFDEKTKSFKPRIQNLVYQNRQNNNDFSKEIKYCNQVSIARAWAQEPTIQNIRYLIIDSVVFYAINRNPGYNVNDIAQLHVIFDGMRDRKQFPLLRTLCVVPTLGMILGSYESQSKPDGALTWLNEIVRKGRDEKQKYHGDVCSALINEFADRADMLDPQHAPFTSKIAQLEDYGFQPAKSEIERIIQAKDYLFDKICLQPVKEKEQAAEAEQQKQAKADGKYIGLTNLRHLSDNMFDRAVDDCLNDVYEQYRYAFQSGYKVSQFNNFGILKYGRAVWLGQNKGAVQDDLANYYDTAYNVISRSLSSKNMKLQFFDEGVKKTDESGKDVIVGVGLKDDENDAQLSKYQEASIDDLRYYVRNAAKYYNNSDKCATVLLNCIQIRFVRQYKRNTFDMIPKSFWDGEGDQEMYDRIKNDKSVVVNGEKEFNATVKKFIKTLVWYIVYWKIRHTDKDENGKIIKSADNDLAIRVTEYLEHEKQLSTDDKLALRAKIQQIVTDIRPVLGNVISVSISKDADKNIASICYRAVYPAGISCGEDITDAFKTYYDAGNVVNMNPKGTAKKGMSGVKVIMKGGGDLQTAYILESLHKNKKSLQFQHVLLGEDISGNQVSYDKFMSGVAEYMAYAIYADTGAGKGIMTNNLLAHAIASKCKIAYIDGKPDTGIQLGSLAWRRGKEAFIFDGKNTGGATFAKEVLENYSCGIRSKAELRCDLNRIPGELIEALGDRNIEQVLNVTRYLRCLQLVADIIIYRGKVNDKTRFVAIFDECTNMAKLESDVRKCLDDARGKLAKKKKKRTDPDGAGILYIDKWLDWADNIAQDYVAIATINLRPSNTTLFFIFQRQLWLSGQEYSGTIQSVIKRVRMSKIVGCGGMQSGALGEFGNNDAKSEPWGQLVETQKFWAITGSNTDISHYTKKGGSYENEDAEQGIKVFKPYTLYGNDDLVLRIIANNRQATVDNIQEEIKQVCTNEGENADKELKTYRKQIQYFAAKLEDYQDGQLNVADVLQQAYTYAEDIVKKFGYSSLKSYVYQLDLSMQQIGDDEIKSSGAFEPNQTSSDSDSGQDSSQAVGDVTRDATSKEKKSTGSTQPGSVRLTGATEEERLQQAMFMGVDTTNMRAPSAEYTDARRRQQPQQQNQYQQRNPFARTANDRAIQQDMATDDPDIGQAQQGYFSEDQNGNTIVGDQNYGEGGELLTKDNYIPASKRAQSYGGALLQSFRMLVDRHQPFTKRGAIMRARYAMTINGLLINEIENSVGGWGYVKTLVFTQTKIVVNGKRINPHDYLQDEWGNIDLQLAINAGKIISRFRNLQSLQFDDDAYYKFFDQLDKFGDDRIKQVFNKLKQLRALCNVTTGVVISRHEGLNQTYSEQVDQLAKKGIEQKAKDAKQKEAQEGILKKGFHYTFGRGIGTNIAQMAQLGIGFFIGGPLIALTALAMQRKAMTKVYGQPQNGNTNRRNNNNNTYRPMLG